MFVQFENVFILLDFIQKCSLLVVDPEMLTPSFGPPPKNNLNLRPGVWGFCLLGTPFSRPHRLGCPLRWWGLGRRRASVATPCTRAPTLAAPRVLLPLFRTRAPLLRAQVWLFGCPFLRSPKHPLAGWLARLRAPSIPVVVGVFSGPLRGGPCPCGLLAPAFSRSCTSRPRPRFFPEASFPSSLAWYPV